MHFISPLWLVGLLPWGMVAAWLLLGKSRREFVPYLPLWRGTAVSRERRSMQRPPLALALMLLAMLLAVLASARPAVRVRLAGGITILVDRGATMSAKGTSRARFMEMAGEMKLAKESRVMLVDCVSGERGIAAGDEWEKLIAAMPRTALDTAQGVRTAVTQELAQGEGPVVLLSDHPVQVSDPGFTQVFPKRPLNNVGISALAARESPSPQVMVGVRNDSALGSMELIVSSGAQRKSRRIDLPARGTESKVFVDLPQLGDLIEARLNAVDDLEADNTAWLGRELRPPRLEMRDALPEALRRMVEVYHRHKPPREGSPAVLIVNQRTALPSGDAGVIVETASAQDSATGELQVVGDPVTATVDWKEVVRGARVVPEMPEGWKPLVKVGDRVFVASRDLPARQLWVGFDSGQWSRSADFVVFWTNVFDWVGGAGREFAWHPTAIQGDEWKRQSDLPAGVQANAWPGVFKRSDGAIKAVDAMGVRPEASGAGRAFVSRGANLETISRELDRWFFLVALACVLAAAWAWHTVFPLAGTPGRGEPSI